ncbi:N-acetylmuramic acid 6-phosphate etherase [Mesonia sp. K7]|uniref:N-acetylmuramic acid 6-phosphate etherase n=1 Tax=Mesonia sp. K7 TaxID=2218606 RepID=UPI000DA8DB6E|nr:N-acetylmuramic acid 6-phosphate etherase [Mesonia sp. K7]PZD79585.1 N-acetylmuramic acid 6-phosphate etherase [Mesonia sp. K7]
MPNFIKTTEQSSLYDDLEKMSLNTILTNINQEDQKVALAVQKVIPQVEKLIEKVVEKLKNGGRLFYVGAGTSGRLGILDASECPPTFGVSKDLVIGLIAGGDLAIRNAVENAEDDPRQAEKDLESYHISSQDVLVGIAASGTTPYVLGAIDYCQQNNIITGGITCNEGSPLAEKVDFPMVAVVGPEFVTGSSRMKAGTAQKLILNMITTSAMIKIGRVKGNKMVDMQLSNEKLVQRGTKMIMEATSLDEDSAKAYLLKYGSVRAVLKAVENE